MNETFSEDAAAVEFDGQLVPVFVQDTDDYPTDGERHSSVINNFDEAENCEVQAYIEDEA